jgi:protein-tyrosine phosphatase/arsenate reductase
MMFEHVRSNLKELTLHFDSIPEKRKELLLAIANYIRTKKEKNEAIQLMFVCTHNSRRSHFGQIAAALASSYYGINHVKTFSGGTEATAFNPNAIKAVEQFGLTVKKVSEGLNPHYEVYYSENEKTMCFSKVYNDAANPQVNFAAIMTCGDAEENCPFIPGVELRIATTYEDPKISDGTPLQEQTYLERFKQIATETLYVFSKI